MFFKTKKVIGLDIGSSSLKIAELDVSKNGATLQNFRLAPTPMGAMAGGEITDIGAISGAIRALLDEMGEKRKSASIGMWGMAVIVKKITMPKMDKKLLADQIRYEAEQYIPFDINNVSLAHHVLASSATVDTSEVLLVAAQNELVMQYSQTLEGAGLNASILDVNGFALANCFEMNYGRFPNESIGLFNVGATVTNFVVVNQGDVVFCRDIPIGGSTYTNELSKGLGITPQEAEGLKLSAMGREEVPDDAVQILSTTNDMVAEEVRNSLDFLSATTNGLTLNRCMVTGGASQAGGLLEAITRVANAPLDIFNPFLKIKVNSRKLTPDYINQIAPFAAVAVGLGLRQVGDT